MKQYTVTLARLVNDHCPGSDPRYKPIVVEYFDDRDEALRHFQEYPRPSRGITYKITLTEITPKTVIDSRITLSSV